MNRPAANEVARFVREALRGCVGKEYAVYQRRALVRMRGPFVQLIGLYVTRGGALLVLPTYYVVGASPGDPVLHQTLSLYADSPRRWMFMNPTLDQKFAQRLVEQTEQDAPLSFTKEITDE